MTNYDDDDDDDDDDDGEDDDDDDDYDDNEYDDNQLAGVLPHHKLRHNQAVAHLQKNVMINLWRKVLQMVAHLKKRKM